MVVNTHDHDCQIAEEAIITRILAEGLCRFSAIDPTIRHMPPVLST